MARYEIKLSMPTVQDGVLLHLDGVGEIPNNGSIEFDDADYQHGKLVENFKGSKVVTVTRIKDNPPAESKTETNGGNE